MEADVAVKETVGNINVSVTVREEEHGYTDNYSGAKHLLELECKRTVSHEMVVIIKQTKKTIRVSFAMTFGKEILYPFGARRLNSLPGTMCVLPVFVLIMMSLE